MNSCAVPFNAGFKRPAMRVEALELRQQCRMDVEHAPAPARNEPGRQEPHEAGEADDFDSVRFKFRIKRAFERFAILAESLVIDNDRSDGRLLRAHKPGRVRPVRRDQHDLRRIILRPGRLDQRHHVGSAAGDEHGDAFFGHTARHDKSRSPRKLTAGAFADATTSPRRTTVSPFAEKISLAASAPSRSSNTTMPMPQLNVRSISLAPILPVAASHLNTGSTETRSSSNETQKPGGKTRGIFSVKPPPVMCASALTAL